MLTIFYLTAEIDLAVFLIANAVEPGREKGVDKERLVCYTSQAFKISRDRAVGSSSGS